MPRIPVRTTPYHTLPRCTRHYKSKRDLILRALGKASFINGSQFVIAWISPKGEVDVYASELLQSAVSPKEGGVLHRKELEKEAGRIKGEMGRRWEEIRRLEEQGEAPVLEDDGEAAEENDDNDDEDGDKTLVEDGSELGSASLSVSLVSDELKKPMPAMMSTFPVLASTPASIGNSLTRQSTPAPPMHTLTLAPDAIDNYYTSRFAALQQATCKLVVKAWIKVIEPKKQMKFPYNKGEDLKPTWWPEGVRHREPDHLSKTERLTLLSSIVRSPLISVSRLELSTAEAAAFISRPRLAILREVYLVAKEEEKRRKENDTSDLVVHLPNVPVSPSAMSPEGPEKVGGKRAYETSSLSLADKENIPYAMATGGGHGIGAKRVKSQHAASRLAPLTTGQANYYEQPFTYAAQWRDLNTPTHLSPYPSEMGYSAGGSEYGRSPNPETVGLLPTPATAPTVDTRPYAAHPHTHGAHPTHLAPILNHQHSHGHSPVDSPGFPHTATLQAHPSANGTYYARSPAPQSYMQQQQLEYLQAHGQHYDYGSPYLAEGGAWDGQFAQPA